MKNFYSNFLRRIAFFVLPVLLLAAGTTFKASAQNIVEGFDNITTLAGNGWAQQNLSSPVGTTGWFQGNDLVFTAFTGATTSYIGANFNNTGNTGTISNWLFSPTRTYNNGDVITFYTRKADPDDFPDRLQVRLSTNGASVNAGGTANSVGDFTTLLVDINTTLITGIYPIVWTQYTINITGLPGPTSGRVALRYYVTNAGLSGANSDYIGIDQFTYTAGAGCAGLTYPPSFINETETCSTDANGGCNMVTPAYQDIACSTTVKGTSWADGTNRDTDWYRFSVASATTVTLTASAEFPFQIILISLPCPGTYTTVTTGNSCQVVTYSQAVAAGQYVAFISPQNWDYSISCSAGLGIGNDYYLTMTMPGATTPTITPSGPTTFCAGGSVTLTSSASTSYLWSPGGATTQAINVTTSGSYTVTAGNVNGCGAASAATPVTVNAAPTVNITGNPTTCSSDTLTANATAGSGSITGYQWQLNSVNIPSATGSTYIASSTGNYTVIVTNSNGCSTTSAIFNVTASTGPTVNITGNTSQCVSDTLTANATGALAYQWQLNSVDINGATNSTYVATTSGDYTVTVTGSGGCTSTSSVYSITVNAAPTVSITGINYACSGNSQTLNASATAGSGTITGYQWYESSVALTGETNSTYSATAAGSYTVTVFNSNGCSTTSAPFSFTVANNPTASITGTASICSGAPTLLTANATAGSGSIIGYQWQESNIDIAGETNTTYSATTGGSYTVIVTNSFGCTVASAPFVVTANASPTVSITGSNTSCSGSPVLLIAIATAGSGNITGYQWQESSVDIPGETDSAYTATTAGTYTVVVTNSNGCSTTSAPFTITVVAGPTVSIIGDTVMCEGDSNTLTAIDTSNCGNDSFQWYENNFSIFGETNSTFNPTASGSYTVVVTNACGCSAASTPLVVTVDPLPVAGNTFSTIGDQAFFTNTSTDATTYSWDFGDGSPVDNSTNPSHMYTADGTYIVTLIACNVCSCDTIVDTVTVSTTLVGTISTTGGMHIYPNPVNETLNIDFNSATAQNYLISVINSLGQALYSNVIKNGTGNIHSTVDVSELASGCYTLQITGNASVIRKKFIKE
jgi:PKD repeat protein